MSHQEQQARLVEAQAAQRAADTEPRTVGQMKAEMLALEGGEPTDIKRGLEVAGRQAQEVRANEEIDPGWSAFEQRQAEAEMDGWMEAAEAFSEATYQKAVATLHTAEDDSQLLAAALDVASGAPDRYESLLDDVEMAVGPEYAGYLAGSVDNVLDEMSISAREHDFQQEMAQSEAVNIEHAQAALAAAASRRGLSTDEIEHVAATFVEDTGVPLRTALTNMPPGVRENFVEEVSIQSEVDERATRLQQFKASFFTGGTDIQSGLRGKGIEQPDLPPSVFDADYHRYKVEQQIRREDAERQKLPGRETPDQIRRSVYEDDSNDWREGLETVDGRKLTLQEIAANDPDSPTNVAARQRQRDAMKLHSMVGGRRVG